MVVAIDLSTVLATRVQFTPRAHPGATPREQRALDTPREQRTPSDQWAVRRYLTRKYPASFTR